MNNPFRPFRAALIVILYILSALVGCRTALFRERQSVDVLISLSAAAVTVLACVIDARVLGRHILHSLQFIMLFTWPLSPLVYLLFARGLKGLLWFLLHGTLLVASYLASFYVTALLIYRRG